MSREERWRWWAGQWRRGLPGLVTLALLAVMTIPVFSSLPVLPQLGLLAVFVWATFQPGLMPPWLAFLLGLAADALFGLPIGINATLLPLTALFVRMFEARFGHHVYGFDWAVLAAVALVYELLVWQFLKFTGTDARLLPLLLQWLTTVATYPAMVVLCAGIQRRWLGVSL